LFANPKPFIAEAIATAKKNRYIGYHIDFEPPSGVVASDTKLYTDFLDTFAQALHQEGFILSVDVARWSIIWDFSLLAKTHVDKIYTMETYTKNITFFEEQVEYTVRVLGLEKAAIGFDSDITPTNLLPDMLATLKKYGVTDIGLWRDNMPVSQEWFNFFKDFLGINK